MGEGLLAKFMGKKKIIAETGAGQHGVALATAAAYFGLKCDIYMGAVDIKKQAPNVSRMRLLGANVIEVTDGQQTLKEAVDAAFNLFNLYLCHSGNYPLKTFSTEMLRTLAISAGLRIELRASIVAFTRL